MGRPPAPAGCWSAPSSSRTLDGHLGAVAAHGRGRLVLIGGEAGIGKSALVRAFCEGTRGDRVLRGACDALFTPRPLGPFVDIADEVGGELGAVVAQGAAPGVLVAALGRALRGDPPDIVVLEDLHWADEATLDVLRLLGRRIESLPALVLATYRDDEIDRAHPLRIVLGELPGGSAPRIALAPLSAQAVAQLAGSIGVDRDELHRRTAGNPFFVTEVLAAADAGIPATVRDAVLARAARLDDGARALLDAVAIVPLRAEVWLLAALADGELDDLDACVASGMLRAERDAVELPSRDRAGRGRGGAVATPADGAAPQGARGARRARGAPGPGPPRASRRGRRRRRGGAAARPRRRRAGGDARVPSRGGRAVRPRIALRRGPAARAPRRAAGAPLLRVLPHQRHGGRHRRSPPRARRTQRGRRSPARGRRAPVAVAPASGSAAKRQRREDEARRAVELLEPLPPGSELAMAYSNLSQLRMLASDQPAASAVGRARDRARRAPGGDGDRRPCAQQRGRSRARAGHGGRPGQARAQPRACAGSRPAGTRRPGLHEPRRGLRRGGPVRARRSVPRCRDRVLRRARPRRVVRVHDRMAGALGARPRALGRRGRERHARARAEGHRDSEPHHAARGRRESARAPR